MPQPNLFFLHMHHHPSRLPWLETPRNRAVSHVCLTYECIVFSCHAISVSVQLSINGAMVSWCHSSWNACVGCAYCRQRPVRLLRIWGLETLGSTCTSHRIFQDKHVNVNVNVSVNVSASAWIERTHGSCGTAGDQPSIYAALQLRYQFICTIITFITFICACRTHSSFHPQGPMAHAFFPCCFRGLQFQWPIAKFIQLRLILGPDLIPIHIFIPISRCLLFVRQAASTGSFQISMVSSDFH